MKLLLLELQKIVQKRTLCVLLILVLSNVFFLHITLQMSNYTINAASIKEITSDLSGFSMEQKNIFLTENLQKTEEFLMLENYYIYDAQNTYSEAAVPTQQMQKAYMQAQENGTLTRYNETLHEEYKFFQYLQAQHRTVFEYEQFLEEIQIKSDAISSISIFQKSDNSQDVTINAITNAYANMADVHINWQPQEGVYFAIQSNFTDVFLIASMFLLALVFVRVERDVRLLDYIRTQPNGRFVTACAKLAAYLVALLVIVVLLYGANIIYCSLVFGLGDLQRSIQSLPFLMYSTYRFSVWQYLLLYVFIKWLAAFVMGLWMMACAIFCKDTITAWFSAIAMPVCMFLLREFIPAIGALSPLRYANTFSFLQTNEIIGNYIVLSVFNNAVPLIFFELFIAIILIVGFGFSFLFAFAKANLKSGSYFVALLPVIKSKKNQTNVFKAEFKKIFITGAALLILICFLAFSLWQGVSATNNLSVDEVIYKDYMQSLSGELTTENLTEFRAKSEEFSELIAVQRAVEQNLLHSDTLFMFSAQQQKYNVYQRILYGNVEYVKNTNGAYFVYESGYLELFAMGETKNIIDAIIAGALVVLCVCGVFAYEKQSGMFVILRTTPLGRSKTFKTKILQSIFIAIIISFLVILPHVIPVVRFYGLSGFSFPAVSIRELSSLPTFVNLAMVLIFWLISKTFACIIIASITLWLGHKLGNVLYTLLLSLSIFCLPLILVLVGVDILQFFSVAQGFDFVSLLLDVSRIGLIFSKPDLILTLLVQLSFIAFAGFCVCDLYCKYEK